MRAAAQREYGGVIVSSEITVAFAVILAALLCPEAASRCSRGSGKDWEVRWSRTGEESENNSGVHIAV